MYEGHSPIERHSGEHEEPKIEKGPKWAEYLDEYHRHVHDIYSVSEGEEKVVELVTKIGRSLEADGPRKGTLTYKVINHSQENAFACGSVVYVYSGLLTNLKTDAQIAGVIAHEITHIENGDTWQENEGPRTITEEMSRGRIQEYMADSVLHKLTKAGYNPAAYEQTLARFAKREWETDFTHGGSGDRQAAFRAQLHLTDFETTAKADTERKTYLFSKEMLGPLQKSSKFEEARTATASETTPEAKHSLEKMETKSLLMLMSEELKTVDTLRRRITGKDYKRWNRKSERDKDKKILDHSARLASAIQSSVEGRIGLVYPDMPPHEKTWLRTLLFTQVQNATLTDFTTLERFVAERTDDRLAPLETELAATLTDKQRLVEFATFTRSYAERAEGIGCVADQERHPEAIFSRPRYSRDGTNGLFYAETAKRLLAQDPVNEKLLLTETAEGLGAFEKGNTVGSDWVKLEAENGFRNVVNSELSRTTRSKLRNSKGLTPYAQELQAKFAAEIEEWSIVMRRGGSVNSEQVLIEQCRKQLIDENKGKQLLRPYGEAEEFTAGITSLLSKNKKEEQAVVSSFAQTILSDDPEARKQLFATLDLDSLRNIRQFASLDQLSSDYLARNKFAKDLTSFILTEYTPTPNDLKKLRVLAERRAYLPSIKSWRDEHRAGGRVDSDEEALEKLGITTDVTRVLGAIEVACLFRETGGEKLIYEQLGALELQGPARAIVFDALLRFARTTYSYEINKNEHFLQMRDQMVEDVSGLDTLDALDALKYLKYSLQGQKSLVGETRYSRVEILNPLAKPVMEKLASLEIDSTNPEELKRLYDAIGVMFENDRRSLSQLQYIVAEKAIKLMDFDQGKQFLHELFKNEDMPLSAADYFQEHLMRTPEQMQSSDALAGEMIGRMKKYGSGSVGMLATFDFASEKAKERGFMTSSNILKSAIESHENDSGLRALLIEGWYTIYSSFETEFNQKGSLSKLAKEEPAFGNFISFDDFVAGFYENLTQVDIDVLIHKLLLSPKGALRSWDGRKIITDFLKEELDSSDPKLQKLLVDIAGAGLGTVDPVRIYGPIADVLRKKILIRPTKPGSNAKAAAQIKQEVFDMSQVPYALQVMSQRRYVNALLRFKRPESKEKPKSKPTEAFIDPEQLEQVRTRLRELVEPPERSLNTDKFPPLDYVLNAAGKMGAVGVRFLQLLGQYVDIPEDYRAKFDSVYDGMRGQLKWTAWRTLEREAGSERATPELKAFYANLADLSPTIGGGSLMTVYKATLKNGEQRVLKVLNPNAEEFIRQYITDAKNILEKLGEKKYPFAQVLLKDLEQWLIEDINSRHKTTSTDEFVELHGEETIDIDDETVRVSAPKQTPTGTKYILVEEFIEGKNLSELLTSEDPKAKTYVRALKQSYEKQLETFASDGMTRIHTDVHIGNARIGADGTLHWIDRGHYIECSKEEIGVLSPFLKAGGNMESLQKAIDFLLNLPENKEFRSKSTSMGFRLRAAGELFSLLSQFRGSNADELANKFLISLREQGLHIPIKYSLLFKNARAVTKMTERAGVA